MYIFDIDGTLSIVGDRIRHITGPIKDWEAFYSQCGEDEVNEPIADLLNAIQESGEDCWFCTGRPEKYREQTETWLKVKGLSLDHKLLMRKTGDYRSDVVVKPELLEPYQKEVIMIFEDRQAMTNKWRKLGYTCLQVVEGNY